MGERAALKLKEEHKCHTKRWNLVLDSPHIWNMPSRIVNQRFNSLSPGSDIILHRWPENKDKDKNTWLSVSNSLPHKITLKV